MSSCLGFYVSDGLVKYAKITMDHSKNMTIENYGIRFTKGNVKSVLNSIIEETNSSQDLIAINPQNDWFIGYTMFNQGNSKNFAGDVAKLEFESWCEKNGKIPAKYSYVYSIAEGLNKELKYNAALNVIEKETINQFSEIENTKVTHMVPVPFLINRLVPNEEKNYILVNLDEKLSINVVKDHQMVDFKFYEFGMKALLDQFSKELGSYQKAYEACRQLNVYSDEENNNDKRLEEIAEPILQEILRSVAVVVNKYRQDIHKVILTGYGSIFTNIDVLFREYLNCKCDFLKPNFLKVKNDEKNIMEIVETVPAMALALEGVYPQQVALNYIKGNGNLLKKFDQLVGKSKGKGEAKASHKKKNFVINENIYLSVAGCVAIVSCLCLIAYFTFSFLYMRNVNATLNHIQEAQIEVNEQITKINADISYINKNKNEYKKINDKVKEIVEEIEENKVSKYSTYNVASFLQNIIKVIPKNVRLVSISSDDNKNIVIKAESSSYANLGYFVSALKISGTLNNIQIKDVQNSTTTIIEIGGELP